MAANPVTSGLHLQLDARTISASDGDLVSAWADQSGLGNDASSSGSNRPTYKTNIFGGSNPSVRFANKGLTGGLSSFGTSGFTVMALLCDVTAISGGIASVHDSTTDTSTSSFTIYGSSISGVQPWQAASFGVVLPLPSGAAAVVGAGVSATEYRQFMNGVFVKGTVSKTIASGVTGYSCGCRWFSSAIQPSFSFSGDMGSFVIYNRLLTNQESYDVANWMLTEFGVRTVATGGGLIGGGNLSGGLQ